MPLKILLIDDEELTPLALSKMLSPYPEKYEVCGIARNGAKALEFLEETEVDLVIVDIRMPVMDGIEFLKELEKRRISLYSIVLSAYRDFEYAQQALHYGASDYLLKPVSREKLLETLEKAYDKIQEHIALASASAKSLLHRKRAALHTYLEKGVENDYFDPKWKEQVTDSCSLLLMTCPEDIPQEFQDDCRVNHWIPCTANSMLYLFPDSMSEMDISSEIKKVTAESQEYFLPYLCFTLSDPLHSFEDIPKAYAQCMYAQEYYFYFFDQTYIPYSDIKCIQNIPLKTLESHFQELEEQLFLGDEEKTFQKLGFIYSYLSENKNVQPAVVHQLFYDFLVAMMDALQKNNNDIGITDYVKNITLQKMQSLPTLMFLYQYVFTQLDFYFNHIETLYLQSNDRIVSKVKDFCAKNYSTDLSLDDIAASVFISKNYLAQIFKEKTGISLWNYFTDLRIEKAKELLSSEEVKASKVAEMVGYKNASHFGRVFKERTGLTPKDYQQRSLS